jgi:Contractile injection system tube protein
VNVTANLLTKLAIDAYEDVDFARPVPDANWQALFNPTELAFSRKNRYVETQSVGTSAPQQSYAGGEPDQVQLDLLLDGTGVIGDAGSVGPLLDALLALTRFQGDSHQPYYVHAYWGRFSFRGILTQADVTYKLFDRSGEPLRATVKLSLKEARSPQEQAAQEKANSPDLHQTWLVADGDRLDVIAATVYGAAAYWRPLAAANRLRNPRALRTGQLLLLPPIGARR